MKKTLMVILFTVFIAGFLSGELLLVYADEQEEFTLEEITVTAQKREQDLQKVAVPVEVVQGYEITEMGLQTLVDVLENVSSVLVNEHGEDLTVVIRGMDDDEFPGNSLSNVAVTVDGAFSSNLGVGQGGMMDMQRVEVLIGPQGTLYSRNSAGGVVNMISNEPSTEKYDASGSIELGNYSLLNAQGMINAPVSETLAIRGAFSGTTRAGYLSNGTDDRVANQARLRLGWYPSENLSVILTYSYMAASGRGVAWGVTAFEDEGDVEDPWTSEQPSNLFHNDYKNREFYINLTWDTPIGELTFQPTYTEMRRRTRNPERVYDAQRQFVTWTQLQFLSDQHERSAELRMNSHEGSQIVWIAGLYYYWRDWINDMIIDDIWYNDKFYAGRGSTGGTVMEVPSRAAFANITYSVSDIFRLVAGGRYTADEEDISGVDPMSGQFTSNHYESSHFDYKLAAEYDLGESSMVWADYSTGYKHVMRNAASQTLKSYQIGSKNRFLDNKMQLNASAFYYDYSNFAIMAGAMQVVEDGVTTTYMGQGIGDAVLYGIDLSTDLIITNRDSLNIGFSYLNAETDQVIITYTEMGGIRTRPPVIAMAGKPLNNSPRYTINGTYKHRFDLTNGGSLTPRLDVRFQTKTYLEYQPMRQKVPAGMDLDKVNTEPAHYIADVSLNYISPSGKWSLNGYVKNVTNHAEKTGFMRGDLQIGSPRTFGAVLSLNL